MKTRDHYLTTLWIEKIWKEINPEGERYVKENLLKRKSKVREMEYELLSEDKILSILGEKSFLNSKEKTISHFSQLQKFKKADIFALQSAILDFYKDLEFVRVRGIEKDNPYQKDYPWWKKIFGFFEDKAHFSPKLAFSLPFFNFDFFNFEQKYNLTSLTSFNHFIDIKKGEGKFDDFDGYSYYFGSAKKDQYERKLGICVDSLVMFWFSREYILVSGKWKKSPPLALKRYSFPQEKGIYFSKKEELKARFPEKGIPYSVFMPIDNLARYWYQEFLKTGDWLALAPVIHAIEDVAICHHSAGYLGNWHKKYEQDFNVERWLYNFQIEKEIKNLVNQWKKIDNCPPSSLTYKDRQIFPKINWRIDHLITWLALNSYYVYDKVYHHFREGYKFDIKSALCLLKKAVALGVLVMEKALKEYKSCLKSS